MIGIWAVKCPFISGRSVQQGTGSWSKRPDGRRMEFATEHEALAVCRKLRQANRKSLEWIFFTWPIFDATVALTD